MDQLDVFIGKKLRLMRSLKGFSQERVGEEIGVTFQQIQKYERGANSLRSRKLYDLSRLFEVPIQYFFEGFDDDSTLDMQITEPSKQAARLIRSFSKIQNPHIKDKLISLVCQMVDEEDEPEKMDI